MQFGFIITLSPHSSPFVPHGPREISIDWSHSDPENASVAVRDFLLRSGCKPTALRFSQGTFLLLDFAAQQFFCGPTILLRSFSEIEKRFAENGFRNGRLSGFCFEQFGFARFLHEFFGAQQ